jgi:hypothetical protein
MTTTRMTEATRPPALRTAAALVAAAALGATAAIVTAVVVTPAAAQAAANQAAATQAAATAALPFPAALGAELPDAQKAHLWRVAGWGGASLIAGIGLLAGTDKNRHPGWRGFGIQAAAWGAINLGIVAWAFASGFDAPAGTLADALAAEDGYGNILLVNLGLNMGYMAVGAALALAAGRGFAHPDAVRGHGLGVVVQGLGLLALDGIAYAGSRARMDGLLSLAERVEVGAVPGTVDVTLVSLWP